jgi:energy-coupling factor transport system ATP-binding protein
MSAVDDLSGGQQRRVALARLLTSQSPLLVLDEPLAGLDQQGIRHVLDLLESIVRDHSVTLVIVEHVFNLPQIAYLATSDWLLNDGRIECSRTAPTPARRIEMPMVVTPAVQTRPGWFDLLMDGETEITDEPLPRGAMLTRIRSGACLRDQEPVLEIRDLIVQRGSRVVVGLDGERQLSGFDLSLKQGEIAILQAPNGWGKSTLLEAIAGFCPASSGEVILNGQPITKCVPWRIARMGLKVVLSQNQFLPTLSLDEIASLGGGDSVPEEFESDLNRSEGSLSGGEKQRFRLQLALSGKSTPAVLLLDEPFAGLDENAGAKIALNLKQASQKYPLLIAHPASL